MELESVSASTRNQKSQTAVQARIRIVCDGEIAIGPGKAELMEHIAETGSISAAAKQMDMSYMRAWMLVRTMNKQFRTPVISVNRGGKAQGGASLTACGKEALKLYRQMESRFDSASRTPWNAMQRLLRK